MSSPDDRLTANSLVEAYLYLKVTPCASCGRGPLRGSEPRLAGEAGGASTVTIAVTCAACRCETTETFHLEDPQIGEHSTLPGINPTDEPSHILDVGQWIVLFRMLTEEAAREADRVQARSLGIKAARCLDEALKFYDEQDNDLPPSEAFFCKTSRARFRESPEQFSRQRLLGMRSKLPRPYLMQDGGDVPRKKPWWKRRH